MEPRCWLRKADILLKIQGAEIILLGVFATFCKAAVSFVMYVSTCNNLAATGQIFVKFNIWGFFGNMSKFKFDLNLVILTGTLHECILFFMMSQNSS